MANDRTCWQCQSPMTKRVHPDDRGRAVSPRAQWVCPNGHTAELTDREATWDLM